MGEVVAAEKNNTIIDDNNLCMAGFPEGIKAHSDSFLGKGCGSGAIFPVEKISFIPRLFQNHGNIQSTLSGSNQLIRNSARHVVGKLGNFEEIAGDDDAGTGFAKPRKESICVFPVYQQGCLTGMEVT